MHMKNVIHGTLLVFAAAQLAGATTIIQSSGNSGGTVPLGYYAPYAPANTPIVYAVGWTQTSAYQNIDVNAALLNNGAGTIDYALVTAIGPGTTFAADGITHGSVNIGTVYGNVDLFQLPSLAAGTYYLVLDSPTPNLGWDYNYPYNPSYTTDTGVSFAGDFNAMGAAINTGCTPASSFNGVNLAVEFSVTGTPSQTTSSVPEPGTLLAMGLGLLLVSFLRPRRTAVVRNCSSPPSAAPTLSRTAGLPAD